MAADWIYRPDPEPWQLPRKIAGLLATNGDQPPRKAALALTALLCIQTWNPPDPMPVQKRVQPAPLSLTYGQQPPIRRDARPQDNIINAQWVQDWKAQSEPNSVIVRLASADQPPRLKASIHPVIQAWQQDWTTQSEAPNAAWNVPAPVVSTFTPYSAEWLLIVLQAWRDDSIFRQPQYGIASFTPDATTAPVTPDFPQSPAGRRTYRYKNKLIDLPADAIAPFIEEVFADMPEKTFEKLIKRPSVKYLRDAPVITKQWEPVYVEARKEDPAFAELLLKHALYLAALEADDEDTDLLLS